MSIFLNPPEGTQFASVIAYEMERHHLRLDKFGGLGYLPYQENVNNPDLAKWPQAKDEEASNFRPEWLVVYPYDENQQPKAADSDLFDSQRGRS